MSTLAHDLHVLVRALDRSAEARLAPFGITYTRYLALVTIDSVDGMTQRDLAGALGQTEATASRTSAALSEAGLVEVSRRPGQGNRRNLTLTEAGEDLLSRASERLGSDFDEVVREIGQDPDLLAEHVRRLTTMLGDSP